MEPTEKTYITVEAEINVPILLVWKYWTSPEDIVSWNNASDNWHTPRAENDLRTGGKFKYRMESKDGTMGFDFEGIYDEVIFHEQINYTIADGRKVKVIFSDMNSLTELIEIFEAEDTHSVEMQLSGWQAILNNFKKYAETNYQQSIPA